MTQAEHGGLGLTNEQLQAIKKRAESATPGPLYLCHHLASEESDASCHCGYRGGIFTADGGQMVCEMGSTQIVGEEGLEAPRMPRKRELATAQFFAHASPDVLALIAEVERLKTETERLRGELRKHAVAYSEWANVHICRCCKAMLGVKAEDRWASASGHRPECPAYDKELDDGKI